MKRVLIKNADWIITMDESLRRLQNADILIEDRQITAIGKNLDQTVKADEVISADGKIIIPGFVNVHHHTFQTLVRNIPAADGLKLEPWIKVVCGIFKKITPDVARAGALGGLGDLLKTGCTTSNDLFYAHPAGVTGLIDREIEAAAELGIRFHPTRGACTLASENIPEELVGQTDEIIEDTKRLIRTYHDTSQFSMCQIGIAPSMPQYETLDIVEAAKEMVEQYDIMFHGHLSETTYETQYTLDKYGCRPVEWFQRQGILGSHYYYAHCIHLNDEEIRLMADTDTGISHCPISNMILNSGPCPIPKYLKAGAARVGIGVDGAASNNSSNMLQEIRSAYLLGRLAWGYEAPSPEDILAMATVGGAKILGRDDIGSLAPGMAADLTIMDWSLFPYAGGQNDPVDCVVMSGDSRLVDTVFVNGQPVVKKGRLCNIDEEEAAAFINRTGNELLRRAGAF